MVWNELSFTYFWANDSRLTTRQVGSWNVKFFARSLNGICCCCCKNVGTAGLAEMNSMDVVKSNVINISEELALSSVAVIFFTLPHTLFADADSQWKNYLDLCNSFQNVVFFYMDYQRRKIPICRYMQVYSIAFIPLANTVSYQTLPLLCTTSPGL